MVAHSGDRRTNRRRPAYPPLTAEVTARDRILATSTMNGGRLSPVARLAWLMLSVDGPSGEAPDWHTLGQWCKCSARRAKRAVAELTAAGLLRWDHGYYGLRLPPAGESDG